MSIIHKWRRFNGIHSMLAVAKTNGSLADLNEKRIATTSRNVKASAIMWLFVSGSNAIANAL